MSHRVGLGADRVTILIFALVGIALLLIGGLIGLWLGVRYCAGTLLPRILAALSDEELAELAKETAKERDRLQG
jgi:hypothetical protein